MNIFGHVYSLASHDFLALKNTHHGITPQNQTAQPCVLQAGVTGANPDKSLSPISTALPSPQEFIEYGRINSSGMPRPILRECLDQFFGNASTNSSGMPRPILRECLDPFFGNASTNSSVVFFTETHSHVHKTISMYQFKKNPLTGYQRLFKVTADIFYRSKTLSLCNGEPPCLRSTVKSNLTY